MKLFSKSRPRRLAVGVATAALLLPLAVGQVVAPAAQAAVTCDKTGVTSVSGKDDSVTATTYTVSVNGVQTSVCELKFDYAGLPSTGSADKDDSSVYTWNVPADVTSIDYVIVSGGGGGGSWDDSYAGGGGNGGGVARDDSVSVQGLLTVQVGAGGAGGDLQKEGWSVRGEIHD